MSRMPKGRTTPNQPAKSEAAGAGRKGPDLAAAAPSPAPTRQLIENRAYELYLARSRNGEPGDATSDWLRAEREVTASTPEARPSSGIEVKSAARGERLLASGD